MGHPYLNKPVGGSVLEPGKRQYDKKQRNIGLQDKKQRSV